MILALVLLSATTAAPSSPNRCGPRYAAATAQLGLAGQAIKHRDWNRADAALDTGLDRLGHAYAPPEAADDTGLGLVVAKARQRQGQPRLAAEQKRRVLESRLQLCAVAAQRSVRP